MRIINNILIGIILLLLAVGLSHADTHTAASCSRAAVNAAIALADHGDTVSIPAGTCSSDWTVVTDIDKAITLQGAGAGSTVITTNITDTGANNYVFRFPQYESLHKPTTVYGADQAEFTSHRFRITGMTINTQYKSGHVLLANRSWEPFEFMIDNCTFSGAIMDYASSTSNLYYNNMIVVQGLWKGLIHSNTFTGNPKFHISTGSFDDSGQWGFYTGKYTPGTNDAIYIEDNTITMDLLNHYADRLGVCSTAADCTGGSCDCGGPVVSANLASKVVVRYNDWVMNSPKATLVYPHGGRGASSCSAYSSYYYTTGTLVTGMWYKVKTTDSNSYFCASCPVGTIFRATSALALSAARSVYPYDCSYLIGSFSAEMYGNYIVDADTSPDLLSPSAGRNLTFNNKTKASTTPSNISHYHQANDSILSLMHTCGSTSEFYVSGDRCSNDTDTSGTAPHNISRNYSWNNRTNAETDGTGTLSTVSAGGYTGVTIPVEDVHFYHDNASCTKDACASGVGCGSDTPVGTCTKGTAYWKTAQACDQLTANTFGKDASTAIAGTLYRCTAANTWTVYFSPYQYPHAWRGSDTTAPTATWVSPTIQQACTVASEPYTQDVAIAISTNENATCRFTVGSTEAYADLDTEFTGAGGTSHTGTAAGLVCGNVTPIYYACADGTNISSTTYTNVSVADKAGVAPTITNATVSPQACASAILLALNTDIPSYCRYCVNGVGGCSSATDWADRTQMMDTGGATTHHDLSITQTCSTTAAYEILCQDTQGTESANSEISITVDAAKAITGISLGTGSLSISTGSGSLSITIK